MTYSFGFYMDQIAGHITNYRNLRSIADQNPDLRADWYEIHYYKAQGVLERLQHKAPIIPPYVTGVIRGTYEMSKALRGAEQYDAILTNASVGVFFSHSFRKIPTIIDFDCTPLQIDHMKTYGAGKDDILPLAMLKKNLFKVKMEAAVQLQAWSKWAKQSAVVDYGIAPAKIFVNPPGVNLDFWKPNRLIRSSSRAEPLKILFVGGDFRRKGGELLVEWFKSHSSGSVELHLVTKEPVVEVAGIYVYPDLTPNSPKLLQLFQSSHLFVLPSLGECFGIATVEAMAAGLPVIASDVGGTGDIIVSGQNGFIVPCDDKRSLAAAITTILENAELRERMSQRSRQLAEERFDLTLNAARTLDALKKIAKNTP